jgi:hypothetical protein
LGSGVHFASSGGSFAICQGRCFGQAACFGKTTSFLLLFIPLSERSIEAKHSLAKKNLQTSSRPSAAAVSLALRSDEILQKMENEEGLVNTITDAFDSHRRTEQIIISTGLASHPTMNGCIARESSLRRRDVALCFYHCDMESQFLRHNIVVHARKSPRRERGCASHFAEVDPEVCVDAFASSVFDVGHDIGQGIFMFRFR